VLPGTRAPALRCDILDSSDDLTGALAAQDGRGGNDRGGGKLDAGQGLTQLRRLPNSR
jgi:hypothetical protein